MTTKMSKKEFFPPRLSSNPTIYAYELPDIPYKVGLLKIGQSKRSNEIRIDEQTKTAGIKYNIVFEESAMKSNGSSFTDTDIHTILRRKGILNPEGEWFKCSVKDIEAAIREIKTGERTEANRTLDFGMRPEQEEAVSKTISYFRSFKNENPKKTPHFLWNAKMRFVGQKF
jgi:hypothetical protein